MEEHYSWLAKRDRESLNKLNVLNDPLFWKLHNARENFDSKNILGEIFKHEEEFLTSKKLGLLMSSLDNRSMPKEDYQFLNGLSEVEMIFQAHSFMNVYDRHRTKIHSQNFPHYRYRLN